MRVIEYLLDVDEYLECIEFIEAVVFSYEEDNPDILVDITTYILKDSSLKVELKFDEKNKSKLQRS